MMQSQKKEKLRHEVPEERVPAAGGKQRYKRVAATVVTICVYVHALDLCVSVLLRTTVVMVMLARPPPRPSPRALLFAYSSTSR